MNPKHMFSTLILAGILLSLALTACSDPASASPPPEQVVEEFYRWHLGYPGNSLVDRAYHDSEYLAPSFVREVDELLNSSDKGGFDPFLLAQDMPEEITVEDAVIDNGVAMVLTHQKFGGNPNLRDVTVELAPIAERWKITAIYMAEIAPQTVMFSSSARLELAEQLGVDPQELDVEPVGDGYLVMLSPRGVVQAFYGWYLAYIGERGSDAMRNPLVDRAYRDSDYLADSLIQEVDDLLNSFDKGGFDPFLLAQDIPERIVVGEAVLSSDVATVEIYQHFAGNPDPRAIMAQLILVDGTWKITGMMPSDMGAEEPAIEPAQVAEAFYKWYLAYIGDPATESFRNPMADRAYRESELLTGRFVRQIDELLASFDGAGYDPFLCAQAIPQSLSAEELVLDGDTAEVEVTTSFIGHRFRVDLVSQDGVWKIDDIRCTFDSPE
jgi:hypothetical protein